MNDMQEILSGIKGDRYRFPAAQRLVADYVVKNYEQIPFLSITALARNCGVSEKTVVKFCNSLGFAKFTEFKRTFSAYAQSKLIISNKLSSAPTPDGDVFERTMRQDIAAIEKTMTLPENRAALPDAAHRILAAKRVYVTGGRASAALAALLASMLRYLGLQVQELLPGACDYYDRLMTVRPDDLVHPLLFPLHRADRGGNGVPAYPGCAHRPPDRPGAVSAVCLCLLHAAMRGRGGGLFPVLHRLSVPPVCALQHAWGLARHGRRRSRPGTGARPPRPRHFPVISRGYIIKNQPEKASG